MEFKRSSNDYRVYKIEDSCVFKKNEDEFGGLSNMATVFITEINSIHVTSIEAIYQASKFPFDEDLQNRILLERSPFTAKMIAKKGKPREDWNNIKIKVMRWCLQVKLAQNYNSFGDLLNSTRNRNIVENSNSDQFWGAKKINEFELEGKNALGRLLMELRERYLTMPLSEVLIVPPPSINDFLFLGKPVEIINNTHKYLNK